MQTEAIPLTSRNNSVSPVPPAPFTPPDQLDNEELHRATRVWTARGNVALAALLAHLGEIEARKLYRNKACQSLYTYCVYILRMSEDAAFRRAKAARFVKQHPRLIDALSSGELHLTGLLLLGPHLTDANLADVLARAKHRSKREIERLVRQLDPLPDVPARIQALGPEHARPPERCTWERWISSFEPVRHLPAEERPRTWLAERAPREADAANADVANADAANANDRRAAPARGAQPACERPQRYHVQFTASEEYVALLDEARDLLSHAEPGRSIEAVHLRAMRLLVADLRKRRRGDVEQPRERRTEQQSPDPRRPRRPRHAARAAVCAGVRREVWARDGARCTFVDDEGRRCAATSRLEMHHVQAFAKGGGETTKNLTLRCRTHNVLAAEEDFGEAWMARFTAGPTEERGGVP